MAIPAEVDRAWDLGDSCPKCPVSYTLVLPYAVQLDEDDEDVIALSYRCAAGHRWGTGYSPSAVAEVVQQQKNSPNAVFYRSDAVTGLRDVIAAIKQERSERMKVTSKIHSNRDGDFIAISTDAPTESDFLLSLEDAILEKKQSGEKAFFLAADFLKQVSDIVCKLRGYKSDVVVKQVIVSGRTLPDDVVQLHGTAQAKVGA
jgi:hypothetical protein